MASNAAELGRPRHVLVVGGGLAGLSASLEALDRGARVTLIEKEAAVGGNSQKATSGINGAGTKFQANRNIQDVPELFREDTIKSGHGLSTPELVDILVTRSAEGVHWLQSKTGLDLSALSQLGGHSRPRTHRVPAKDGKPVPVGWAIMSSLKKNLLDMQAKESDRLRIVTSARVKEILTRETASGGLEVTGVKYDKTGVGGNDEEACSDGACEGVEEADAVVLTSGGFGFDHSPVKGATKGLSLLQEFAPHLGHYPTTNGPWATGDGVKLGRAIGAHLKDMDQIQVHPTGFVDPKDPLCNTKMLAPEALRGCGGVLLNKEGKRFVNELGFRDYVTEQIVKNCSPLKEADQAGDKEENNQPVAYLFMNDAVVDDFGRPAINFYVSRGVIQKFDSGVLAAQQLGLDPAVVAETFAKYGKEDPFGKVVFPVDRWTMEEPMFVAMVTPSIHYTMGGLAIDNQARVQRKLPNTDLVEPVKRLFAAGEVTGGVHGGNRLGGNSLLECVVFGRLAGSEAAKVTL